MHSHHGCPKKNTKDKVIITENAEANAEEEPSLLVLNYARECTAEAPASLENFVTSSKDCLETISSSEMIKRKTETFLTVGPSGSEKSTIIKGLLEQDGLIDVSVQNFCKKYNVAEGDISMQALVWCHLHHAISDVVKNKDIPMEKWKPLPSTKKAHWRSALLSVFYSERAAIYEAWSTNGTSINPESSRFFTLLILRHKGKDMTHFFFDFRGYEPLLQTKSCASEIPTKTYKNQIDTGKSSQFITKSLLVIVQALISEFNITALNFISILKVALESSRGACLINCLGRDISKFTPNMRDLCTKLIQKFKIKQNMRAAVEMIKSPCKQNDVVQAPEEPTAGLSRILSYNQLEITSNLDVALMADRLTCSTPITAPLRDISCMDFSPISINRHGRMMLDLSSEIAFGLSERALKEMVSSDTSSSARNLTEKESLPFPQKTLAEACASSGKSSTDTVSLTTSSSAKDRIDKESPSSSQGTSVGAPEMSGESLTAVVSSRTSARNRIEYGATSSSEGTSVKCEILY